MGLTGLYEDSRKVDCLEGWSGKGGAVSYRRLRPL